MNTLSQHIVNVQKGPHPTELSWKSIQPIHKILISDPSINNTTIYESIIPSNNMAEATKVWSYKLQHYVFLSSIFQQKAIISFKEEVVEYLNQSDLGYLQALLNEEEFVPIIEEEDSKESQSLPRKIKDNDEPGTKKEEKPKEKKEEDDDYDIGRLFDEPEDKVPPVITKDVSEKSKLPNKRTITIEQSVEVDATSVTAKIPVTILIYINDQIEKLNMVVDCNQTVNDIKEHFKKIYKFLSYSIYCKSMLLENNLKIYSTQIKPNSVILLYPVGAYKIFKRLGNGDSSWSTGINKWDAVTFEATKNVLICGFSTYTPTSTSGSFAITFKYKLNNTIVYEGSEPLSYDGTNRMVKYELKPDKYINMKKLDKLVVMQYVNGATTYRGSKYSGKQEEIFKIKSATESTNGTGTSDGQIAELFYILI